MQSEPPSIGSNASPPGDVADKGAADARAGAIESVATWWALNALESALRVGDFWLGWLEDRNIPRIPVETGGPDGITVPVLGGVTRRPLQLRCESFRAIGWSDEYAIDGRHVKFVPEVLGAKHSEFVVSVALVDLPDDARRRTIVYEGRVVDRNGRDVCDPIHFVKPAE
jgi:hypothetical protein